ncbi:MAG: hypothetical protein WD751_11670 [Anaerolineales bacterium]
MLKPPRSLLRYAGLALLVLAVSYILFTLFPEVFPHPSEFSSFAYVVAFLAMLKVWLQLVRGKRRWLYLPILILCLLALLDETGFGSEVMDIQPFYSTTLHTEIRDLHNAVSIVFELGSQWLADLRWNATLSDLFLLLDLGLAAAGIAFGWLLRRGPAGKKEAAWQSRAVALIAAFTLVASLAAAAWLLALPQDPKNAMFLGYSAFRLVSMLAVLAPGVALALLVWKRGATIRPWLGGALKRRGGKITQAVLWIALLAGVAYQFYAPLVFLPDDRTRLERITPLVIWVLAVALFWLVGLLAWRGRFRRSITDLVTSFFDFLKREPAYFYTGAAIFLILIAQLNDKGILPLDEWIRLPGPRNGAWGLWTEEVFEMVGAFLLIVAAGYFHKDLPVKSRAKGRG